MWSLKSSLATTKRRLHCFVGNQPRLDLGQLYCRHHRICRRHVTAKMGMVSQILCSFDSITKAFVARSLPSHHPKCKGRGSLRAYLFLMEAATREAPRSIMVASALCHHVQSVSLHAEDGAMPVLCSVIELSCFTHFKHVSDVGRAHFLPPSPTKLSLCARV